MKKIIWRDGDPFVVQFDECDLELWVRHAWFLRRTSGGKLYMQCTYKDENRIKRYMIFHRNIMGCVSKDGKIVDHASGDTLDNRRSNLRVVDVKANIQNSVAYGLSSRFKGVHFYKGRFAAKIYTPEKKQQYLGRWKNEIEAAYAYDMASLEYQPEYGRRNFLPLVR